MDRGDLDDAADRVMLHYADLYGDDYIEDKTLEIEADDDFNLEDVEREFENAASADEEKQEEAQPRLPLSFEDADYGTAASYDMEDIPPDVMADPIALLGWLDSHPPPQKKTLAGRLLHIPIGCALSPSGRLHLRSECMSGISL